MFSLLSLGFAIAGAGKAFGLSAYRQLAHEWGWSEDEMRQLGLAEIAGGVLVGSRAGRRLGGLVLTAASVAALNTEFRQHSRLALPRTGLLFASVLALLGPARRRA